MDTSEVMLKAAIEIQKLRRELKNKEQHLQTVESMLLESDAKVLRLELAIKRLGALYEFEV